MLPWSALVLGAETIIGDLGKVAFNATPNASFCIPTSACQGPWSVAAGRFKGIWAPLHNAGQIPPLSRSAEALRLIAEVPILSTLGRVVHGMHKHMLHPCAIHHTATIPVHMTYSYD
jgi:hypothetical protein